MNSKEMSHLHPFSPLVHSYERLPVLPRERMCLPLRRVPFSDLSTSRRLTVNIVTDRSGCLSARQSTGNRRHARRALKAS
jgi:hypothetical protein